MYAHIVTLALGIMMGIVATIIAAGIWIVKDENKRQLKLSTEKYQIPFDPETWTDEDRMTVDLLRRELDAQVIDIQRH